jgi:hypothetical protein
MPFIHAGNTETTVALITLGKYTLLDHFKVCIKDSLAALKWAGHLY